jgi:hypothetical protein
MTIQSLTAGYSAPVTGSSSSGGGNWQTNGASGLGATDWTGAASQSQISSGAKLLGALQKLEQQDPGAFQQITSSLSNFLQSAAQQAQQSGNTTEAAGLNQLASAFQSASQTGNLSSLQSVLQQQSSGTSAANLPPARDTASDAASDTSDAAATNPNLLAYQQNSSPTGSTTENLWTMFQAAQ